MQITNQFVVSNNNSNNDQAMVHELKMEDDKSQIWNDKDNESSNLTTSPDSITSFPANITALPNTQTTTIPTTNNNNSSASALLSMMQSMPFFMFPQFAVAAAAAAVVANRTDKNDHSSLQTNNPTINNQTNFSIDSILANHQSQRPLNEPIRNNQFEWNGLQWHHHNRKEYHEHFPRSTIHPSSIHNQGFNESNTQIYNWIHDHCESIRVKNHCEPEHNNHFDTKYLVKSSTLLPKSSETSISMNRNSNSHYSRPIVDNNNPNGTGTSRRKTINRGPRIPFTTSQVAELESKFNATQYLSSLEVSQLARRLDLTDNRVSELTFMFSYIFLYCFNELTSNNGKNVNLKYSSMCLLKESVSTILVQ
ncbi:hypothetical protein RDWZM_008955 [Blomia tropicalis]|uniref:Homeobox domain-containing protein n=1 Tax=Blomia tropicalis TaxID=40697 RepID=A0A9Q0M327_BLOTA|nr:hypothetical protein RDWZM_008955 [Blomia tropicalis]